MENRIKQIIFDKLYEDLKHVEIIPYEDSVWFINRENKYWYLRYRKSGSLWWRFNFFNDFFPVFSMGYNEYEWIIVEWVEEVLNCKVKTPYQLIDIGYIMVEEVLNCKVKTPNHTSIERRSMVEKVLNCKVTTSTGFHPDLTENVEMVLNSKMNS
jgi:hypothetical protein